VYCPRLWPSADLERHQNRPKLRQFITRWKNGGAQRCEEAAAAAGLVRPASRPAACGAHGARERRRPEKHRRTGEGETATAPASASADAATPGATARPRGAWPAPPGGGAAAPTAATPPSSGHRTCVWGREAGGRAAAAAAPLSSTAMRVAPPPPPPPPSGRRGGADAAGSGESSYCLTTCSRQPPPRGAGVAPTDGRVCGAPPSASATNGRPASVGWTPLVAAWRDTLPVRRVRAPVWGRRGDAARHPASHCGLEATMAGRPRRSTPPSSHARSAAPAAATVAVCRPNSHACVTRTAAGPVWWATTPPLNSPAAHRQATWTKKI